MDRVREYQPPALEVVPTAELPITNKDVPTDESPTEVVGVPTAESPTPLKSRNKRAIHRNARNLLVTSGHMANEEDYIQFKSLSPLNMNIQKSRRVTFSVYPVNEGSQRLTSVPSEGEALVHVVYVDPISRPRYEPIDMKTVGLRRLKRRKSEKKQLY